MSFIGRTWRGWNGKTRRWLRFRNAAVPSVRSIGSNRLQPRQLVSFCSGWRGPAIIARWKSRRPSAQSAWRWCRVPIRPGGGLYEIEIYVAVKAWPICPPVCTAMTPRSTPKRASPHGPRTRRPFSPTRAAPSACHATTCKCS